LVILRRSANLLVENAPHLAVCASNAGHETPLVDKSAHGDRRTARRSSRRARDSRCAAVGTGGGTRGGGGGAGSTQSVVAATARTARRSNSLRNSTLDLQHSTAQVAQLSSPTV
jgi:hypothetical protein